MKHSFIKVLKSKIRLDKGFRETVFKTYKPNMDQLISLLVYNRSVGADDICKSIIEEINKMNEGLN